MTKDAAAAQLAAALRNVPDSPLGLAVSGGSDSLALMHLAADWANGTGRAIHVVTVDHRLRPEAAAEAAEVARQAAALGLSHDTLEWAQAGAAGGNLMDAARRARYRLMSSWAAKRGIGAVLLGHTRDDVTETLLMRLTRGAGVDGLSAMAPVKEVDRVPFHRPLLSVGREELRDVLRRRGVQWINDPSNDNPQFERVRMRRALAALSDQGVSTDQLAQSAQALGQARHALNWAVAQFVGDHVSQIAGDLAISADPFAGLPEELQRRLLTHALLWINGQDYGPRGAELTQFRISALNGQGVTLAGVRMTHRKGAIYLHREYAAVADLRGDPTMMFDTRWQITGPVAPDHYIAPMGEAGLRSCPNWRDSLRPAAAVMADPAVWRNDQLISAPLVGLHQGWSGELAPFCRDFGKWLVSR